MQQAGRMDTAVRETAAWTLRHPKTVILLSLLTCALFSVNLIKFHLSASPRDYLGEQALLMKRLLAVEDQYVDDSNVMLMFQSQRGSLFTREDLSVIQSFTEAAWDLTGARRVDSLTNYQYSRAIGDDIIVSDFVEEPANLSDQQLGQMQDLALRDPRLRGLILSDDAEESAVMIRFDIDANDINAVAALDEEIGALITSSLDGHPHLKVYRSGYVAVVMGWLSAMNMDVTYLYTGAIVTILVGLCLFFRSVSLGLSTLTLGILATTSAIGMVCFFGQSIQAPSVVGGLLVLMLALADSVHIIKSTRRELARGLSKDAAIIQGLLSNYKAVFITSFTTAIGFLSFLSSEFLGTRIMGSYVAFGVMLACLLSMTLLPAMMCYCRIHPSSTGAISRYLHFPGSRTLRRFRWPIIVGSGALVAASVAIMLRTPINDNAIHYIKADQPLRQDLDVIENELTGSTDMIWSLQSNQPGGVSNPTYLAELDQFAAWLREQQDIRFVSAYTDTIKHLNRNMNGDAAAAYRIPDNRQLAAQYLLFYEMSLPYGLDLTTQVNIDKTATRLVALANDIDYARLSILTEQSRNWLKNNAPSINASEVTGSILTTTLIGIDTFYSMVYGAMVALFIIGLFLLFVFRTLTPGIYCTIMVVSPIAVTYGLWAILRGTYDMAAAIALCMIIGIVVDNAVHFISRFLVAYRDQGQSRAEAIDYAITSVSSALTTNTLVLAAGFSMLFFSAFKSNDTMGTLTVISLITALIGTFTLLPSLLSFGPARHAKYAQQAKLSAETPR